jgi:DNA-binding FrmR family transcriptional regulator
MTSRPPVSVPVAATRGYAGTEDDIRNRLRRVEGQVRGIQGMVEADRYCIDVLQQITAAQAALDKVALALVAEHCRHCVIGADGHDHDAKLEELMTTLGRLMGRR